MPKRLAGVVLTAFLSATFVAPTATAAASDPTYDPTNQANPIDVQVLAITDLHGYLAPTTGADATLPTADGQTLTVGGGAFLSAHLDRAASGQANSIRVSNGDNFSGWPWQVMFSRDEATIEYLNHIGLDVSSVGNHEVDVSLDFLTPHMTDGECLGEPGVDSCFPTSTGEPFTGARFPFLAANLRTAPTGQRPLASSWVDTVRGADGSEARVGFIGVMPPDTERVFSSYQVGGLVTTDLAAAVDSAAAELQEDGAEAIVLLAHEGATNRATYEACDTAGGPIMRLAEQVTPAVDVVIGGHWHSAATCTVTDPAGQQRPVLTPGHHGRTFGDIRFQIDPSTGDVLRSSLNARNVPVTRDIAPDPEVVSMVQHWEAWAARRWAEPIGTVTEDITRARDESGESAMGNLVADAYRDIGTWSSPGGADLALTDPSHVRNPLTYAAGTNPADSNGTVLFGESWSATGRAGSIVTVSVSGHDLREAFEQQWQGSTFVPLSVSDNVEVSIDPWLLAGERVVQVTVDGKPIKPNRNYRVAMPSRLALGLDGFPALKSEVNPTRSDMDYWAFQQWMERQDTLSAPATDRVHTTTPVG
ncbi:bifunctional metallophosphatase/5'-nucleotidase [Micromonospora sp. NPDC047620]|uniref:bifunctional metallophosphatase/5'-nucleotidase n=1 Tax=Micromonospora sp. NPDC047620 TaxID=3364251 RepID=UPI00371A7FB9